MAQAGPDLGVVLVQRQCTLKLGDRLRQSSFCFISPAQETMIKPKIGLELDVAVQLRDRRVPLSREDQDRCDIKVPQGGEWSDLLSAFGFRQRLRAAPHRGQKP